MLRALLERGIRPDVILGTSIGAINGAAIAARPDLDGVADLAQLWREVTASGVFAGSLIKQVTTLARTRTHLHSNAPLARLLAKHLPVERIEDLPVRFECVAASIEHAAEHWFTRGPIVEAVLASAAVPGILPPVTIGREHFIDGGIVNSVPVGRAVALRAKTVYVCHVGRIDRRLAVPRHALEVGLVAFEIARRHRFHADMAELPDDIAVHILPTGERSRSATEPLANLRYRDFSRVVERIDAAHRATRRYLDQLERTG
jgi:NTE family protein